MPAMRRAAWLALFWAASVASPGSAQEAPAEPGPESAPARPDPTTTGVVAGAITFPPAQPRRRRARVRYPGQAPGSKPDEDEVRFPAVVYLEDVTGAASMSSDAKAVMSQEGIAFDPAVLPVRVGTTVSFPNLDPVYHNVLSYSTPKRFDLGRYAKGEERSVTFDQPGVVRLACEIHAQMRGYVVVLAQTHFTVTDREGRFSLAGCPPGEHRVAMWHDDFTAEPVVVRVEAGATATVKLTAAVAR